MKTLFKKIESKILTKLFTRWLKDEYDLELLGLTKSLIVQKETEIKQMVGVATRVQIEGYRRY